MNKKIIGALTAMVAVLALVAGGTFAAWTDFNIQETEVGAGILALDVSTREGGGPTIAPLNLAPGENKFQEFYLASSDGDSVPDANLTMVLNNFVEEENGCSSNSEALAEGVLSGYGDLTGDPLCTTGPGEFSSQARIQVLASAPVPGPSSCPSTGIYGSTTPSGVGTLLSKANTVFTLGTLAPGEGLCVRVEISLPTTATDLVQGDATGYDVRFNLTQV